jgi:RNA polymerase sigma-70 factor (ECF subfamily)
VPYQQIVYEKWLRPPLAESNSLKTSETRWRSVSIPQWWSVNERKEGLTSEFALLHAARDGDQDALDQLLVRHERPLFALCYGILTHGEDAEDAVQETFLRALRALPQFRQDAAFRTWLFRIAINVCLKSKGARRLTAPLPEEPSTALPGASSPEVIALRRMRVFEALSVLLPRQRAVLLLKEREGWSVEEIAAGLGWSERQVRYELSKARRALADWRREAEEGREP